MPFLTSFLPASNPAGKPILSVLAKKTYSIAHGSVNDDVEQLPFIEADVYADPLNTFYSEVVAETDQIAFKPFTDVIVLAKAKTPRGKQAYHLDCEVHVGGMSKIVRVFGNRKIESKALRGMSFSDPIPFSEMETGFYKAYGGIATTRDKTLMSYFPNPIGKGFAIKGGFDDVSEIVVPNLENPLSLLTPESMILSKFEDWIDAPKPSAFGFTRKNFYPRFTYAGILPEQLARAGEDYQKTINDTPLPKMDFKMFQGATDGLWGTPLRGNEPVMLKYMDEDFPKFEFVLPNDIPQISLDIGNGKISLPPVLQTLLIEKEENRMSIVWRGAIEYGGFEEMAEYPRVEYFAE